MEVRWFRLEQVSSRPIWLPEAEAFGFVVELETLGRRGAAIVDVAWLSHDEDHLRRWIVRQLNELATSLSYGTACIELLRGYRPSVPPPQPTW